MHRSRLLGRVTLISLGWTVSFLLTVGRDAWQFRASPSVGSVWPAPAWWLSGGRLHSLARFNGKYFLFFLFLLRIFNYFEYTTTWSRIFSFSSQSYGQWDNCVFRFWPKTFIAHWSCSILASGCVTLIRGVCDLEPCSMFILAIHYNSQPLGKMIVNSL